MRRRWVGIGAAALLGPLAFAGCANIPESGPIRSVRGDTADERPISVRPLGPASGASPVEIVGGFFEAMHAYPPSTEVAEKFLTRDAAESWDPTRSAVIYRSMQPRAPRLGSGTVSLRIDRQAFLDARGAYRPIEPGAAVDERRYKLRLEHGEWRIVNPVDAWYVDSEEFGQYYEAVSLYYPAPSRDALVPYPIYLPLGDQLATSLVREELEGPPPGTASDPPLTSTPPLSVKSVSIDPEGVAEVRLSGPALGMTVDQRQLLSARLVWTLWQVPGVSGVRILVDDARWEVPGVPAVQTLDRWNGYNPSTLPARDQMFALDSRGRLVQIVKRVDPDSGVLQGVDVNSLPDSQWGAAAQGIRSFDVGLRLGQVLAVTDDGGTLLSGRLYNSRNSRPAVLDYDGFDLSEPVSTGGGEWLVADRRPSASRLLVVRPDGAVVRRSFGALRGQRVAALALSPDGTRLAAVTQPLGATGADSTRLVLADIAFGRDGTSIAGIRRVHELVITGPPLRQIRSVGWVDSTTLGVLATTNGTGPAAYSVRIDGSQFTNEWVLPGDIGLPRTLEVSSAPDEGGVYVHDAHGRLWYEIDGEWRLVDSRPLAAPSFPG